MSQATGYFTHQDCWRHEMGAGHPECPERLDAIEDRLWSTDGRFSTIIEGIVTSSQFASLRFEPATSPGENQP